MQDDEVARARAWLREHSSGARRSEAARAPRAPFEPLPPVSEELERALEAAALEANDEYLETFLEPHSFCPFSRGGRARGLTRRWVHYATTTDPEPLLDRMEQAASDPEQVVIQAILPRFDFSPEDFRAYCHALTRAGNDRLKLGAGRGAEVFAVAPLHPELAYSTDSPNTLIQLFRRTPDPTIQWVRLDALEKLYAGRSGDTVFVDVAELDAFLAAPRKQPLFDRIAETNQKMAQRLGVAEVERLLRDLSRRARDRFTRVLLGGGAVPRPAPRGGGCDRRASDESPPRAPVGERDGSWALVRLEDLLDRVPVRVLAAGVEVLVVRVRGDVHVLHGRCPHRNAPLTDAAVEDERLVCPHHGWDFELASGRSLGVPGAAVARFEARLAEGAVWVEGRALDAHRAAESVGFRNDDDVL